MSANPKKEIKDSLAKIRPYIVTTPTFKTLSFGQTMDLKLEQLQHTGSFKCRGAFNSLLDNEKAKQGVVAASGGNHGAAVAYVAQKLGIKSHIFVPEPVSYTHLRAHETPEHLVCRLLLEKKKQYH